MQPCYKENIFSFWLKGINKKMLVYIFIFQTPLYFKLFLFIFRLFPTIKNKHFL